MPEKGKVIGYELRPFYETPSGGLALNSCVSCSVTGGLLSGSHFAPFSLSPKVVKVLLTNQKVRDLIDYEVQMGCAYEKDKGESDDKR